MRSSPQAGTAYFRAVKAPGAPGAPPSWGPGRKQGFGASPNPHTRVWLTIARGNLSEVFYPRLDEPCLHELRFIAAAPGAPPIDDAIEAEHEVSWIEPGVPAFRAVSTHPEYRLVKEFACDPDLNAVLVSGMFSPEMPDVLLYLQASAHLDPGSSGCDGYVLDRDPPVLCLRRPGSPDSWMAVVGPFAEAQTGYLQSSDLFVDIDDNQGRPAGGWDSATGGNAAVGARLGIRSGAFQLAVGFAATRADAEEVARQALERGAARARDELARAWRRLPELPPNLLKVAGDGGLLAKASVAVLRSLEDKTYSGAFIAAPGAPWGEHVQDGNQVYHLVWTRDLYQQASALLEVGDPEPGLRALRYLEKLQRADGSWPQNCRLDGTPHWDGIELDETAYPVLLAWRLGVGGALDHDPYSALVRRAVRHLLVNGPATPLDRWEDGGGLSPSTLAVAIAALAAGAEFASDAGEQLAAHHLRCVADYWNDRLEAWCYLYAFRHYVRLNPDPDQPPGRESAVALEFVELVRRGLRKADDPRVLHSLTTADAILRSDPPGGPVWRRYVGDAYGETEGGGEWGSGPGIGRPWPLLCAERGHWALAAGESPAPYVRALEAFAGTELMLPEQVWDGPAMPEKGLQPGRATGSCSPLGWAHAEYLKLLASLATSSQPDAVAPAGRYAEAPPKAPAFVWHPGHRFGAFAEGRKVLVQLASPGIVRWSADGWASFQDADLLDTGLDLWVAELPADGLRPGSVIEWTSRHADGWEGENHVVRCVPEEHWGQVR